MNLNSEKISLDSSKTYLNLGKCVIKFWNLDTELLKFRYIFAEFKFISEFKYIY